MRAQRDLIAGGGVAALEAALALRVLEQRAENPASPRELSDRGDRLLAHARVREALEPRAVLVDHPADRIPGARERGGGLDESLQEVVERARS